MENTKPEMEFAKLNPLPRYIRRQNLRDLIKKGHDPYTTGLYTGQMTGFKQGYAQGLADAQKLIMEKSIPTAMPESGKKDTVIESITYPVDNSNSGDETAVSSEVTDSPSTWGNPDA